MAQTEPVCTKAQGKGAVILQETEPDLLASVEALLWRHGAARAHRGEDGTGGSRPGRGPLA